MTSIGHFVLRIFEFGEGWSVTLKKRGSQTKLRDGQGRKNKGGSLAVSQLGPGIALSTRQIANG